MNIYQRKKYMYTRIYTQTHNNNNNNNNNNNLREVIVFINFNEYSQVDV